MFFQLLHISQGKRLEQLLTLSMCDTEPLSLHSTRCGEVICSKGRSYINVLLAFRPPPTPFPLTKCPEPHLNCYLLLFSKRPDRSWAHPASFGLDTGLLSPGFSGRGVKWITYLYLVQKLRTSGAVPLLNLYAFLAWTEKTWPPLLTYPRHLRGEMWLYVPGQCLWNWEVWWLNHTFHSYFTVPVTEFDIHLATLFVLIPISPFAACHNWQARRQAVHGPLLLCHA